MTVRPLQRGRWQVCYQNRRFFHLTWQVRLAGDVWRLMSGPSWATQRAKGAMAAEALAAALPSDK